MTIPIWQMAMQAPRPTLLPGGRRGGTLPRVTVARRLCPVRTARVGLSVQFAGFAEAEAAIPDWDDLLGRALEPNIFMDPAFAVPASQHFAEARRPLFILVREGGETPGRLVGLWMLDARPATLSPGFVSGWRNEHTVLGMPLIDRARAADVADAMLEAFASRFGNRAVLVVPKILRTGPTFGLLVSRALAAGFIWDTFSAHSRAVLATGLSGEAHLDAALRGKRRKELARQRRRLEDMGDLKVRSARDAEAIRAATENFLALEERGWKGRRATALLSDPGSSTFLRAMIRLMARDGKCRIDSLELDGRPIAMAIVLASQGRAYFWKTAYDEALHASSPGVQLALDLTRRQLADPTVLLTDSCAIAGHPMIDRIWPDRHELVDLAIALSTEAGPFAVRAMRRERWRRTARETVKQLVRRFSRRASGAAALRVAPVTPTSAM